MSEYPLFSGDKQGAAVWFKLFNSNNPSTQEFVRRVNNVGQETGRFYFTDVEEQAKKKLNNQSWYLADWDLARRQWIFYLLLEIDPNKV